MKRLLTLLLLSLSLHAAITLTVTGPLTVVAGQPATLTITLAGSSGQSIAAIGWILAPQASTTIGIPTAGAATSAVQTDAIYSPLNPAGGATPATSSNGTMIVAGTGKPTALSDGVLATVPVTFSAAGTVSLPLTGIIVANTSGMSVNGVTSGQTFSIVVTPVPSPCAVTGDVITSMADVQALINASLGLSACSFPGFAQCTVVQTVDVEIAANGGACIIH